MPIKLGSKLPVDQVEARIEIVPLIDIMFFLLASFMLLSLSMVNLKSMKVHLPAAATATLVADHELMNVSVGKSGDVYFDARPIAPNELTTTLKAALVKRPNLLLVISGDEDARHGDVIHILDLVRAAGVEKVAFEIRPSVESGAR